MNAFDEIFDVAVGEEKTKPVLPRRKRGAARGTKQTSGFEPLPTPIPAKKPARRKAGDLTKSAAVEPSVATNSEMQAAGATQPCDRKPAKKKAEIKPEPKQVAPSSSPIPRKGRRPANVMVQSVLSMPDATNSDGQRDNELLLPRAIGQGGVDLTKTGIQDSNVDAALLHIVAGWKMRQRWHRAEKTLILQAKAICRAFCDGDKDVANEAYEASCKGVPPSPELYMALSPFLPAIEQFEHERKQIEKNLKKMAKTLPAYGWARSIKGFGELNFVAIIGECCVRNDDGTMRGVGDYRTVSALWKRMGLGLVNGERQRRVADAELAILHGYNPSRRSVAFNIGECLIKAGGEYKSIYDERKAYELGRDEAIRPIQAHRRAARYMTKRLLRKLYAQWRKETRGESGDPGEITLPMAAE